MFEFGGHANLAGLTLLDMQTSLTVATHRFGPVSEGPTSSKVKPAKLACHSPAGKVEMEKNLSIYFEGALRTGLLRASK